MSCWGWQDIAEACSELFECDAFVFYPFGKSFTEYQDLQTSAVLKTARNPNNTATLLCVPLAAPEWHCVQSLNAGTPLQCALEKRHLWQGNAYRVTWHMPCSNQLVDLCANNVQAQHECSGAWQRANAAASLQTLQSPGDDLFQVRLARCCTPCGCCVTALGCVNHVDMLSVLVRDLCPADSFAHWLAIPGIKGMRAS